MSGWLHVQVSDIDCDIHEDTHLHQDVDSNVYEDTHLHQNCQKEDEEPLMHTTSVVCLEAVCM